MAKKKKPVTKPKATKPTIKATKKTLTEKELEKIITPKHERQTVATEAPAEKEKPFNIALRVPNDLNDELNEIMDLLPRSLSRNAFILRAIKSEIQKVIAAHAKK